MATVGFSTAEETLLEAVRKYFASNFANPPMRFGAEFHRDLGWAPALQITINDHLTYFVQPSEDKVYPRIFQMRRAEVQNLTSPISIYSVCPEEVADHSDQKSDIRRLQQHGYGLLTVDRNGDVTVRHRAIPLVQQISRSNFNEEVKGLTPKIRRNITLAYDDYCQNPVTGVMSLTVIVEGMVLKAGRDAAKKRWINSSNASPGKPANTIDALSACGHCNSARAALGGVRSHIHQYRNVSHHFPKNKTQAYKKYRTCRHGFLDGIKQIQNFRDALRNLGLSGNIP